MVSLSPAEYDLLRSNGIMRNTNLYYVWLLLYFSTPGYQGQVMGLVNSKRVGMKRNIERMRGEDSKKTVGARTTRQMSLTLVYCQSLENLTRRFN